jgi:HEAT repeat protein
MIVLFFLCSLVEVDLEKLYDEATTRLVSYRAVKDSAEKRFIALGQDPETSDTTIVFLVSKFDTKSSIERHTLKDILKELGTPAIKWIVHRIGYRGSDASARSLKQSLWVLGEIGGEEIVEAVAPFVDDGDWTVRSAALTALGKSGSYRALPFVVGGLSDEVDVVRKSGYYALSEIATESEFHYLLQGTRDHYYGVRYRARIGLERISAGMKKHILREIGDDDLANYFLILAFSEMDASKDLLDHVNKQSPILRKALYDVIDISYLLEALDDETHPLLKNYLEQKIEEASSVD